MNKLIHLLNGLKVKNRYRSNHREPFIWVFGEWFGEKCYDNSLCLANYVAGNYSEIQVFWASKANTDISLLHPKVSHLIFGTEQALSVYEKAGVVFMNQGLKDFSEQGFDYFDGAFKVNLWHGVMWKRIGHDGSPQNGFLYSLYRKINDYIFGANYYLAVSNEYAKICESAFGANRENIIKAGYPRNFIFYDDYLLNQAKKEVINILRKKTGYQWSYSTKIVTYMPTFRDKVEDVFSFEELEGDKKFVKWLAINNVVLIQKTHFITQKRKKRISQKINEKRIIIFNDINPQILLAASNLLITDYSSCFFDFLLLDRPIIHFLYDYDYYQSKDRGLYYNKEDVVCGSTATQCEELPELIISNMNNPNKTQNLRSKRKNRFMTYEGKHSCEIICNEILKKINNQNMIKI